jgi:FkbM family methyltransferase
MSRVKELLPRRLRRGLGILRSVAIRLEIWSQVATRLKGVGPADRAVLRRAILRAPMSVWQGLDQWQFPMVEADCAVVTPSGARFFVRARTDDLFHVLPGQEPAVEQAIRQELAAGQTFVDAGSNIGYYTILSSRIVGPEGQVVACEMIPKTAEILRSHVAINGCGNVTVVEGALGERSGEAIEACYPDGKFGQASIARTSGGNRITVRTKTLSEILAGVKDVAVMKMDLEGAELSALRGLGTDLGKVRTIIFENRGDHEAVAYLQAQGFAVRNVDGNNAIARREGGAR